MSIYLFNLYVIIHKGFPSPCMSKKNNNNNKIKWGRFKKLLTADLNASTGGWSNKKEGKVFHYNTGIRRRRMELLESFLVLFPIKVPWNQAYNSGVSLAPGYQWAVTSFFFWYKARFCHLLSWFIFPLLLGKLVSSLFQSSIVKRTRSNYCGLANSNGRRHWNEPVKFQNSPRQARKNAYQQVMFFNEFWLAEKGA